MTPTQSLAVQNYTRRRGAAGDWVWDETDGDPIPVRVNVRPLSSGESHDLGLQMEDIRVVIFYGRQWPGNAHSKIVWRGADWDPVGPAVRYDGTSLPFWRVTIQRRGGGDGSGL